MGGEENGGGGARERGRDLDVGHENGRDDRGFIQEIIKIRPL